MDAEKDPKLLDYCLATMAMQDMSDVQVVVIDQRPGASGPDGVEWYATTADHVGDICLWNVMADLQAYRPFFFGDYLLCMHPEFAAEPGFFAESAQWLREHQPDIAISNLMRLGTIDEIDKRVTSSSKSESTKLKRAISMGDPAKLSASMAKATAIPWIYRRDTPNGKWAEDAYFARLDWLDELKFFDHGDRMLFQDVYDLMGEVCRVTGVDVPRIPFGRLFHLWHPKSYRHFSDDVRAWFGQNPGRWEGTNFADTELSRTIEHYLKDPLSHPVNPIVNYRRDARGTVARWLKSFEAHWRAMNPGEIECGTGLAIPESERTGYAVLVDNSRWRRDKAKWKRAIAILTATGKPVTVQARGRVAPEHNCVIDHTNVDALLAMA